MKKILLTLLLILTVISVEAKPVTIETAQQVAENFMLQQTGKSITMEMRTLPSTLKHLYLFVNTDGPGHVYIPKDDCAYPILGYSLTSESVEEISQPTLAWLQEYSDEIESAVEENLTASDELIKLWEKYTFGQMESIPPLNTPISPLLSTVWGTGTPSVRELYRYYMPLVNGVHCRVGCGAIAMAQVMKYYNWPDVGVGQYSYHDSVFMSSDSTYYPIYPSADFSTTYYDWNNMPNSLSNTSTTIQKQSIGLLMYHAGVAVKMRYGTTGSSSNMPSDGTLSKRCIENALKNHFKYNKNLHSVYQAALSDSEWNNILLSELLANRPVIYRGSEVNGNGHIWVCDGVDANGLFHFNGGGGSTSGYYQVAPVPNHQFPKKCAALIGIEPETTVSTGIRMIQTVQNNTSYGTTSVALKSDTIKYQSHAFNSGDTMIIEALATDSTRFMKWNDGSIFNKREEVANRNATYTAIFERVSGDTIYYDNGCYYNVGNWKNSSGVRAHCGIRFSPNTMTGHDSLKSVMLYSNYRGPYTLFIHIGENADQNNLVSSQSVRTTLSMNWVTIQLQQPVQVDIHQPIWIFFRPDSSGYAMPYSPFSGNDNGDIACYNYSSLINHIGGIKKAWMIRGIFSRGDSSSISASPYNSLRGTVTGTGRYPYGARVSLTAIPNACYRFTQWSDGDTSNPRTVFATQNTTFFAYFDRITDSTIDNQSACDSYVWNGHTYYYSTTTQPNTFIGSDGCDSIVTLNLIINHSSSIIEAITACDNYTWHGNNYMFSTDTTTYTTTNAAGCDSVTTLHLTMNYSNTATETVTTCDSLTWHGQAYTASTTTPTFTSLNAAGCDSVTTLHLTVNYSNTGIETLTTCDSLTWHGATYTTSTTTPTFTSLNSSGCDSVTTLHLTVNYSNIGTETLTSCDSLTWHGATYATSTNTPTFTSLNALGCDSVTTLHLTVNYSNTSIETVTACNSYVWHGTEYFASTNTPTYTTTNAAGCDSVVTLHLTIIECSTTAITACDSYTWHGITYTSGGTYMDGTDTLVLTLNYSTSATETVTACDSYTWHGTMFTTTGTMTDTLTNAADCDSVTTLNLTVNYSNTGTETVTACNSFIWHGTEYTASTDTATYTTTNAVGCDSVTTLHLTIIECSTTTITACDSYTWHDSTYTVSGLYTDGTDTLDLSIHYSTTGTETLTACDSLTWHGSTYTASTSTPTFDTLNVWECDSTVMLNLIIHYSVHDTLTETAVDSFFWDGRTLTESGSYPYEGLTGEGCDSIVVLNLIITHDSTFINLPDGRDIRVYPNPTSGWLTIEAESIMEVRVFDNQGKLVKVFLKTNPIDLTDLPTGQYLLHIILHDGSGVKKVIKQ